MLSITEKKSIVAGSSSLTQAFDDCHPPRIESRVSVRYNIELQCGKRTWKLTDATAVWNLNTYRVAKAWIFWEYQLHLPGDEFIPGTPEPSSLRGQPAFLWAANWLSRKHPAPSDSLELQCFQNILTGHINSQDLPPFAYVLRVLFKMLLQLRNQAENSNPDQCGE